MSALTPGERGVGLALYRLGGGTDALEANYALDTDPECQRIARAFTPAVARLVQAVSAFLTVPELLRERGAGMARPEVWTSPPVEYVGGREVGDDHG